MFCIIAQLILIYKIMLTNLGNIHVLKNIIGTIEIPDIIRIMLFRSYDYTIIFFRYGFHGIYHLFLIKCIALRGYFKKSRFLFFFQSKEALDIGNIAFIKCKLHAINNKNLRNTDQYAYYFFHNLSSFQCTGFLPSYMIIS